MAEVTGSIGSERVELNNAATEATLKAMLAALTRQTAVISSLKNGGSAVGGGGNTAQTTQQQTAATQKQTGATNQQTQATGQQTVATNAATASMNALSKGAMILGGIVGDLVGGVAKTVGNLTDFAGGLLDGKGGLSDFYGAMKDLPLGLGMVAGLFQKLAQMQEAELETYRSMTKAGVNFGGQLNAIRQNALDLGLTLDQFGKLMTDHGKDFAMMGGTANEGAESFTAVAKTLRQSDMGKQLRALGYTSEEAADKMANYIAMTGGRTATEMKNTKGIADETGRYMKNLDQLSQLTGESRDALEKKMQEEAADVAWQNYLQTLDTASREKANKAMQESAATGGKGAADALKSKLAGIPVTEAGGMFMAMAQKANAAQDEQVKAVKDGTKGLGDVEKASNRMAVGMKNDSETYGRTLLSAQMQMGGAAGDLSKSMLATQNRMNQQGINSEEDLAKKRSQMVVDEKKRLDSGAATAAESEKAFKDLGASIYSALLPVLASLTKLGNDLAMSFMEFVKGHLPELKQGLKILGDYISRFAKDLFSEEGRNKIINDIQYYLKLIMIEIKKAVVPFYNEKDAEKDTKRLDNEKAEKDALAESARNREDIKAKERRLVELENLKGDQRTELVNKEIAKLKNEKAQLEEKEKVSKEVANTTGKKVKEDKKEANIDTHESVGATVGAGAGAYAMGTMGAALGSVLLPGIGTIIGGALGALTGALIGGTVGYGAGAVTGRVENAVDDSNANKPDPSKTPPPPTNGTNIGKRAAGGPVDAGTPYWVGENGPELFLSKQAGEILSNTAMSTLSDKVAGMGSPLDNKPTKPVPDMKSHMEGMTKNLSSNFKSVADGMPDPTQQRQEITLSRETMASLGKLLPLDSMSGNPSPNFDKDSKGMSEALKSRMEVMSKDINTSLGGVSDKMSDRKKDTEKDTYQETLKKLIPDPTAKAAPVLEGKESALPEQPKTPMLTDMLGSFAKTIMPEFMSKIPSVSDLTKKIDDIKKDPKAEMESMGKSITDGIKNVTSMSPAGALLNPLMGSLGGASSNENLLKEMQQLNKNTVELIKYTKMTLEENKSQTSKLGSLSGNLYV
jgi:hypothetical protein